MVGAVWRRHCGALAGAGRYEAGSRKPRKAARCTTWWQARRCARSHGLGPRGEIVAGERANVRGCGGRGAWRPGSLCMAGVRGGALAMRNFSGFGLHGARKSVPNSPAWRLRLRKMRQLNQLPPPPTRPLWSYLSGTHMGQRIGQAAGREDPGRRRLFQKRRERSVRAVMVPKTPGEKPPGPILSQAQAEAGSGAEPWRSEIFRILRVELLEKTFGEEARQG